MELIKLNQEYQKEFLEVLKVAFGEDEDFNNKLTHYFFNQENLWNYAYGWVDNNHLISTYLSLDVNVKIRNKVFKGHYIDGLATLPAYRKKGLIHQQMLQDAKVCVNNQIPLMLVDPSRDSFYRKFGFEFALNQYRITIDRNYCKQMKSDETYTVKSDILSNDKKLQQDYITINEWLFNHSRYNEMKWPKCYEDIKYKRDDITIAVSYDLKNQPCGYMLYSRQDKNLIIDSYRYTNLEAFYSLKNHLMSLREISNFVLTSVPEDFPIELMIEDLGRPEKKLYFGSWMSRMIRIVDFKGFIEDIIEVAPKFPICIYIKDDILKENEGLYSILSTGEVMKKHSGSYDVTCSITDIVPLLTGLKSAKELYYNGKLKLLTPNIEQSLHVPDIISEIDSIFPKVTTFSGDDYLAP